MEKKKRDNNIILLPWSPRVTLFFNATVVSATKVINFFYMMYITL
jgi:hypothetical protein